ncbi:MAG: chemotaxis response regulator protein-glutamate methylesterase [Gemmatimonadota bacterium]|nr:chemotaxis response regulator protein-glutamate methylesterase [Gemmatimonadota bacterium]
MTRSAANPIRVLVVDDSAVVRGILGRMVDAQEDMRVVTTATNGVDALEALRLQEVDIVLLDIEMPVMDGLTALPIISKRHPRTQVLITSALSHQGASVTTQALALGAVDYVHKPTARDGGVFGVETAGARIIAKIRAIATAPPHSDRVTKPSARPELQGVHPPSAGIPLGDFDPHVLAIAASTGGPNAVATLIAGLPRDFPLPVLVTQHMPPIFTTMFAQRLARESSLPCEEARDGDTLQSGHVYVAPGDRHLTVVGQGLVRAAALRVADDPPEHHCRPAADPMFRSAARAFPNGVLAVVLTGMGEDGRAGCEVVAASGGRIVVQDEATSVVWGMPGSVVAAGVPCAVLPLHMIATHVTSLCRVRS